MKRLVILLMLLAGGCGTGTPEGAASPEPVKSAPAPEKSAGTGAVKSSAAPRPRFADLTRGSTTSVVKLHDYDAGNASAVVEPMIFMTGDAYCRTFKIKRTDGRCVNHAYVTEESHTKVTVPVAADAKYFTWELPSGDVAIEAPEKGGTYPMTRKRFAAWSELNEQAMVAVITKDGVITRMAVVYTP